MIRYRLEQLYLPSLERHFLPLPKLPDSMLGGLSVQLEGRGFSVRRRGGKGKLTALKGTLRIAIDGALGLASSANDMLDALGPVIPELLDSRSSRDAFASTAALAQYFSLKRSGASVELQLFTRMESLRTWTCLRKDGLCGLTPDEAAMLRHLLTKATDSSQIECVTAKPRKGSKPIQVGRMVYYKSAIPVKDFLSSLRTMFSDGAESVSYLPRDSVFSLPGVRIDTRVTTDELGEWCCTG